MFVLVEALSSEVDNDVSISSNVEVISDHDEENQNESCASHQDLSPSDIGDMQKNPVSYAHEKGSENHVINLWTVPIQGRNEKDY